MTGYRIPLSSTTAKPVNIIGKVPSLKRISHLQWLYEPKSCSKHVLIQQQHPNDVRAERPGDRGSIPGRGERIFPLASATRPALGPTQPPAQRVPGILPPVVKRGRGVTLTTRLHLMPRSRMSRSYTILLFPQAPPWRVV
jgi:hypothetical protein